MTSTNNSAVITGASSGIGAEFARKLAARKCDLILVARRHERLKLLGAELSAAYGVDVRTSVADLADPEAVESLAEVVAQQPNLKYLVNNAGFGTMGRFADIDIKPQIEMIRVHVLATVRLTRAALPGMLQRNQGVIINVSSLAAWITSAGNVQYSATKAYLNSFSESLQDELRNTSVRVQALCPGFTYTEFHDRELLRGFDRSVIPKRMWMSAEEVVDYSLKCLRNHNVIVIPGWRNRLLTRVLRSSWLRSLVRVASRYKARKN